MQIIGLHKNIYKLSHYTLSQEKLDNHRKCYENSVKKWEYAKDQGCDDSFCQDYSGISRATYYRHKQKLKRLAEGYIPPSKRPKNVNKPKWSEGEKQLVLRMRRENPTYGKAKIAVILKRDFNQTMSESTVGRILKQLQEKGLVTKSRSAVRAKRKRDFQNGHAQPWTYKDYKTMKIGERVQIDHMTVTKNGISFKHFQAWERKSKYIAAGIFSNATSRSAKRFLMDFIRGAPFKVLSIQVDGGSEFMCEFEKACAELRIPLIVLPPSSPKYNGGVERGNRIFREEFYSRNNILADSIAAMRADLSKDLNKYNTYRPHFSLKGLTPMQYIQNTLLKDAA